MRDFEKRLSKLEIRKRAAKLVVHRLIQPEGWTEEQALVAYGAERISPEHMVIIRRIVAPDLSHLEVHQ